MTVFYTSINTPLGPLTLFEEDRALTVVEWGRPPDTRPSPLLTRATRQLTEYFDGQRTAFDLPLRPSGTPFQQRTWSAMADIPYGQTQTYGEIAHRIASAARAVGTACGANPLPVFLPCHRVLGANRRLTGYSAGQGVETKRLLLQLEGAALL